MKTLSDLKRAMQPGVEFRAVNTRYPEVSGGRRVFKVQSNAIQYERLELPADHKNRIGWLYWPKASQVTFPSSNIAVLRLWQGEDHTLTYEFAGKEIAP